MWNYKSDVVVLVLILLPAKFLGRCKCVCRSWKLLISSSEFIRLHLQYQSSIQKTLHSLLLSKRGHGLAEYSINVAWDSGNLEVGCEIQPLYNPNNWRILVGSCNGLLCQIQFDYSKAIYFKIYGEYEISLCNPITKSTWFLPKIPTYDDNIISRRVAFHGFGYDDVHDTYKVFLASAPLYNPKPIYHRKDRYHSLPDANYEYLVFSLKSNEWMVVSSSCHDFRDYYFHCSRWNLHGVLINHALHWILKNPYGPNKNKKKNYILAFDLTTDQLDILAPLPEAMENVDDYDELVLSVVNGCLLLAYPNIVQEPEDIVDMWVLREYGLKDSWTRIRIHNSPYRLCSIIPVAILEEEEDNNNNHHRKRKLIYHDTRRLYSSESILLSYDVESLQVVMLPPPSPPSLSSLFYEYDPIPLQYVASLVQPHPPSGVHE